MSKLPVGIYEIGHLAYHTKWYDTLSANTKLSVKSTSSTIN